MSLPETSRESIRKIRPYAQGKPIEEVQRELGLTDIVKLASNENPLGPSPRAVSAMGQAMLECHLYPDGANFRLKEKLAQALDVTAEQVVFGAGSSTVLRLIAEAFLTPGDEVVYADPSFIMYEIITHLGGATPVVVPVDAQYRHDLPAMAAAVTPRTKVVFVCNPNNPTGTTVTKAEMDAFLAAVPPSVLVVLDEAYFEYAAGPGHIDGLDYVKAGRNVLVLRSFSKIFGLAGLRVGYGIGEPSVVAALRRVREPFNVSIVAQAAALAAISDRDHVDRSRAVNTLGLQMLYAGVSRLGLPHIPSAANFFMVRVPGDDGAMFQALMQQGVIVRPGRTFAMPGWLRVTVGTEEQNRRFLAALEKALADQAAAPGQAG
ncbi:MAG TPA: histidinol-phosphate transaminase [Symbiobacteriaceae bacterium]|nr:histidinol-phosphate transaminase [Symbiobacteriaceae bacterium]